MNSDIHSDVSAQKKMEYPNGNTGTTTEVKPKGEPSNSLVEETSEETSSTFEESASLLAQNVMPNPSQDDEILDHFDKMQKDLNKAFNIKNKLVQNAMESTNSGSKTSTQNSCSQNMDDIDKFFGGHVRSVKVNETDKLPVENALTQQQKKTHTDPENKVNGNIGKTHQQNPQADGSSKKTSSQSRKENYLMFTGLLSTFIDPQNQKTSSVPADIPVENKPPEVTATQTSQASTIPTSQIYSPEKPIFNKLSFHLQSTQDSCTFISDSTGTSTQSQSQCQSQSQSQFQPLAESSLQPQSQSPSDNLCTKSPKKLLPATISNLPIKKTPIPNIEKPLRLKNKHLQFTQNTSSSQTVKKQGTEDKPKSRRVRKSILDQEECDSFLSDSDVDVTSATQSTSKPFNSTGEKKRIISGPLRAITTDKIEKITSSKVYESENIALDSIVDLKPGSLFVDYDKKINGKETTNDKHTGVSESSGTNLMKGSNGVNKQLPTKPKIRLKITKRFKPEKESAIEPQLKITPETDRGKVRKSSLEVNFGSILNPDFPVTINKLHTTKFETSDDKRITSSGSDNSKEQSSVQTLGSAKQLAGTENNDDMESLMNKIIEINNESDESQPNFTDDEKNLLNLSSSQENLYSSVKPRRKKVGDDEFFPESIKTLTDHVQTKVLATQEEPTLHKQLDSTASEPDEKLYVDDSNIIDNLNSDVSEDMNEIKTSIHTQNDSNIFAASQYGNTLDASISAVELGTLQPHHEQTENLFVPEESSDSDEEMIVSHARDILHQQVDSDEESQLIRNNRRSPRKGNRLEDSEEEGDDEDLPLAHNSKMRKRDQISAKLKNLAKSKRRKTINEYNPYLADDSSTSSEEDEDLFYDADDGEADSIKSSKPDAEVSHVDFVVKDDRVEFESDADSGDELTKYEKVFDLKKRKNSRNKIKLENTAREEENLKLEQNKDFPVSAKKRDKVLSELEFSKPGKYFAEGKSGDVDLIVLDSESEDEKTKGKVATHEENKSEKAVSRKLRKSRSRNKRKVQDYLVLSDSDKEERRPEIKSENESKRENELTSECGGCEEKSNLRPSNESGEGNQRLSPGVEVKPLCHHSADNSFSKKKAKKKSTKTSKKKKGRKSKIIEEHILDQFNEKLKMSHEKRRSSRHK